MIYNENFFIVLRHDKSKEKLGLPKDLFNYKKYKKVKSNRKENSFRPLRHDKQEEKESFFLQ